MLLQFITGFSNLKSLPDITTFDKQSYSPNTGKKSQVLVSMNFVWLSQCICYF